MNAAVPAQVEEGNGCAGKVAHGALHHLVVAGHGEHGAVMIAVGVQVQKAGTAGLRQERQSAGVPALADIDHALQHEVPPGPGRRGPVTLVRSPWYGPAA